MKRILLSLGLILTAIPAFACGNGESCTIGKRSYLAKAADSWDGKTPLPVLLHFHGWGRIGTNVIRNQRVVGATEDNYVNYSRGKAKVLRDIADEYLIQ